MKRRYIGANRWNYWLQWDADRPPDGEVELRVPEGNYREDEGMARYLVRLKLGLKKLPKGFVTAPAY